MVHKHRWREFDKNFEGYFKACTICGLILHDEERLIMYALNKSDITSKNKLTHNRV